MNLILSLSIGGYRVHKWSVLAKSLANRPQATPVPTAEVLPARERK
ncbi:hypothetical protein [Chroogloeocystis siderophila]|nr:hypothetical protein [Chroogloeocystis siderophila]